MSVHGRRNSRTAKPNKLADKLFDEALQLFKRRMERMTQVANPVIKQVYEHQGAMYENIMILLRTVNVCIMFPAT